MSGGRGGNNFYPEDIAQSIMHCLRQMLDGHEKSSITGCLSSPFDDTLSVPSLSSSPLLSPSPCSSKLLRSPASLTSSTCLKSSVSSTSSTSSQSMPTSFLVAYSGGMDSHVLLHALSSFKQQGAAFKLRAMHINHHLHADADAWQQHAKAVCDKLAVDFFCQSIQLEASPKDGLESHARNLRYQALSAALAPEEILLTAHHQGDQAETVLLQALRGAGVDGLAAMPYRARLASRSFVGDQAGNFKKEQFLKGADFPGFSRYVAADDLTRQQQGNAHQGNFHQRPLLGYSKQQLHAYAQHFNLQWVEDSSNHHRRFRRNALRHDILPALEKKQPGCQQNLSRLAEHMAEAQQILQQLAAEDYRQAVVPEKPMQLRLGVLRRLTPARQRLLLRYWFKACRCRMPSTKLLSSMQQHVIAAASDASPEVNWDDWQLRRFRDELYLLPGQLPLDVDAWQRHWRRGEDCLLPHAMGYLSADDYPADAVVNLLGNKMVSVRFRRGGERYQAVVNGQHKSLKKSFQQWGIPPWKRSTIPLVFCGETLVAVMGCWHLVAEFLTLADK